MCMYSRPKEKRSSGLIRRSSWHRTMASLLADRARLSNSSGGTSMRSALPGKNISEVEVTNVSGHGFWLLIDEQELFLPFDKFPWFRDVPIGQLLSVERPHPSHLHWPDLDVDLAVESIKFPDRFPLVSRARPDNAPRRPRAARGGATMNKRNRSRR